MKHLIRTVALAGALLASGAQAVPFHYNFYGTVQQATYDPVSPFRVTPGRGTPLVGRVYFDTETPDLAPDDPNVGVYGNNGNAAFFLQIELYADSTPLVFTFNDYRIGVVNGPTRDRYTLHGEAGTQARALAGGVTPADLPGFPVTISEPGSYRLASDLRVATRDIPAADLRPRMWSST